MAQQRQISKGRLTAEVGAAQVRSLRFDGVEFLRGISAPVRDRNWGTVELDLREEIVGDSTYVVRFADFGGAFAGELTVIIETEYRLTAQFELDVFKDVEFNRAGFCLLHPIRGVAGSVLTVRHPDGREEQTCFPDTISPRQPASDIVGLAHRVGPLHVDLAMDGEIFEMEDQRNWSDASFKTYCRPLSRPYPFLARAGEMIRQRVSASITQTAVNMVVADCVGAVSTRLPKVFVAWDMDLDTLEGLDRFPSVPILARIGLGTPMAALERLSSCGEVALELVVDRIADIVPISQACASAGLSPVRVIALPRSYLTSHQPQGPWPEGPNPDALMPALRKAFPGVAIGGGSLTNFTEYNRCPPSADVDFVTFGNTAIVHAADNRSVIETLEALPDIFVSAKKITPDKPLHLGLFSIGMRTNPYGADVRPNPTGKPMTMARRDNRQQTSFAAVYATGVLALASIAGVDSIALAMPSGDLGAASHPLAEILAFAHRHAGAEASVRCAGQTYSIVTEGAHLLANFEAIGQDGEIAGRFEIAPWPVVERSA